ncbi:MAG: universal stress protein [Cytophagales bacterium]|nr:universal stress protein [Cytophagales bacterium]
MKTILCPVDYSPSATDGLDYLHQLIRWWRTDVRLILVNVDYLAPADPYADGYAVAVGYRASYQERTARLDALIASLEERYADPRIRYHPEVAFGETAESVAQLARSERADLVVMGTAGAHGLEEVTAGTKAADVLVQALCPVLVIPEGTPFKPFKRLVFATDAERSLSPQMDTVLELAGLFEAEIAFLHVLDGEASPAKAEARANFNRIYQAITYENVSFHYTQNPNVEEGIIRFVRQTEADLLVMTTHPRTLWQQLFSRSHTRHLAYWAEIPLLAIHP